MAQYRILENGLAAARQLEREITSACRDGLAAGRRRFDGVNSLEDWQKLRESVDQIFRSALPELLDKRAPIEARTVSTVEFDEFIVENVLFCSLPGWEVNASVYRPKGEGKFPSVVCPTGHSNKFSHHYYGSAQTFARNGYIAVSFCPPGVSGELSRLNDHFENGVIGWLTGIWCQTHFIADALACADYLSLRPDVDISKGIAMTGVSGGGLTTMYCAAYDSRITFAAPVCCITDQEALHLTGLYTSCPEQHGHTYLGRGVDTTELLGLIAPKPLLLVGGKLDQVFDYRVTEQTFAQVKKIYGLYGCPDNANLYLQEDSGHAYTVKMANQVVAAMNRVFKDGAAPLPLTQEDVVPIAKEQLLCYPSGTVNMFTINRDESARLKAARPKLSVSELEAKLSSLLQLEGLQFTANAAQEEPEASLPRRWDHWFQPVVLQHGEQNVLPGLFVYRNDGQRRPAVLYIDEEGKWNGFNHGGVLTRICGYTRGPSEEERQVFSVDVSGFGELDMQHTTYDSAPWNDIDRILTYLSIAHGRPLMAYRVRDALIALSYLQKRPEVDGSRIILAGRGLGAVVALLAGFLARDKVERVIAVQPLAAYACLTESFPFRWSPSVVVPNVLRHLDLPDIVEALGTKAVCIQPADEMRIPLCDARMLTYYGPAIRNGAQVTADGNWEQLLETACTGHSIL